MKKVGKIMALGAVAALAVKWKSIIKWIKSLSQDETESHVRLQCYYDIMTRWMQNKQEGLHIGDYLRERGIQKVAIYGHGKIGLLLYEDLISENIKVVCFIEKGPMEPYQSVDNTPVTSVERNENIGEDAVIITPSFDKEYIEKNLRKNGWNSEILSFSSLLYEMT